MNYSSYYILFCIILNNFNKFDKLLNLNFLKKLSSGAIISKKIKKTIEAILFITKYQSKHKIEYNSRNSDRKLFEYAEF